MLSDSLLVNGWSIEELNGRTLPLKGIAVPLSSELFKLYNSKGVQIGIMSKSELQAFCVKHGCNLQAPMESEEAQEEEAAEKRRQTMERKDAEKQLLNAYIEAFEAIGKILKYL